MFTALASGGGHEVKRHMENKKHMDLSRQADDPNQQKITSSSFRNDLTDQITASEIYFSTFIAEHNIPFLAAKHYVP